MSKVAKTLAVIGALTALGACASEPEPVIVEPAPVVTVDPVSEKF